MIKVFVRYILLLFVPFNLTAIHNLVGDFPSSMLSYDSLEPVLSQTIFDPEVILSVAVLILLLAGAIKFYKQFPKISFGIGWFFISLLPVSYIIPFGGAMAEKYLYIASFGFLICLVEFFYLVYEFKIDKLNNLKKDSQVLLRQTILVGFMVLLAIYSVLTILRNPVWANDISLFSDVVKKSPSNLLANYTLGVWYGNFGQYNLAAQAYQKALEKAPDFWEARFNLANNLLKQAQFDNAVDQYQQVLKVNPNFAAAANSIKNVSLAKASSTSAQIVGDQVAVEYKSKDGLSFFFPIQWGVKEEAGLTRVQDPSQSFNIDLTTAEKANSVNVDDYITSQKDQYGNLVNEGKAKLPNFDTAFVKVWQDTGASQSATLSAQLQGPVLKLQFFLINSEASKSGGLTSKLAKVLVYPANSPLMRIFDLVLGSIKVN